eukprot:358921-Chlamydomonas_euryale.AAC.6
MLFPSLVQSNVCTWQPVDRSMSDSKLYSKLEPIEMTRQSPAAAGVVTLHRYLWPSAQQRAAGRTAHSDGEEVKARAPSGLIGSHLRLQHCTVDALGK